MRSSQNHTKIQNTFSQRKKRIYKNVFTAFLVFACFVLSHCFVNALTRYVCILTLVVRIPVAANDFVGTKSIHLRFPFLESMPTGGAEECSVRTLPYASSLTIACSVPNKKK